MRTYRTVGTYNAFSHQSSNFQLMTTMLNLRGRAAPVLVVI